MRMHKIVAGELVTIIPPAATGTVDYFGNGFLFQQFIPAKGFFYSINAGAVRTWPIKNNAQFGAPLGTTVKTGYTYEAVLYQYKYLIGIDSEGLLVGYSVDPIGGLGSKSILGNGWDRFKRLVPYGSTLLAIDENGVFWKFNFDTNEFWIVNNPI